jgi:hypothetical protein
VEYVVQIKHRKTNSKLLRLARSLPQPRRGIFFSGKSAARDELAEIRLATPCAAGFFARAAIAACQPYLLPRRVLALPTIVSNGGDAG